MLVFEPVDPTHVDNDVPDDAYATCQCPNPDDQYLMEIDAGSVGLRHTACGRPAGDWTDDAYSMEAVPVTLHWHVDKDYWTNEVDAYGDITINALPATKEN
ncbi:hypothetical protein ABT025_18585 [Streptomyces sp. NPDC002809]|uniref:hypothetical protein n=1 Tax=Streptomyces sp. NPDC002809 TaxID=3154433 RepID=UPI0033330EE7